MPNQRKKEQSELQSYLSFQLDGEIFAINVSKVLEILEMQAITHIPQSPDYMRGVLNLRGSVLPVIDMRLKFGLPSKKDDVHTSIVVLDIEIDQEKVHLGALVDGVEEVIEIETSKISAPPSLGLRYKSQFIEGLWKFEDKFILILNVDTVFSSDELVVIEQSKELEETKEEET